MKITFFLFILFCISNVLFAQNLDIHIINASNRNNVQFATIYDSTKNLILASDSLGHIRLKSDNYNLYITHVSYKNISIQLNPSIKDTEITIRLEPKEKIEATVFLNSIPKTNFENKISEDGSYYRNGKDLINVLCKMKLGVLINGYIPNNGKLRSIKFKLKHANNTHKKQFNIEIKLYPIKDGLISEQPINNLPIFIKSGELKNKNELFINERIVLPNEGLFISIEIPKISDSNENFEISFPATHNAAKCELYIYNNKKPEWDINTLLKNSCMYSTYLEGYKSINLGITYYKQKKRK
ncbi:MAG: hypothetical protein ABS68_08060 [Niastella sp. SCN 39-18]|nr:hypothetical protein [Sphingobacteriales bacterium]ODT52529.1 MAG: hypothetical protein ABS68_08060 [Niastella sp. SCN 39-18]OJW11669.1 MAG: hypothetical protein BGO53_12130 [Sphingobacteriales bacterium 39-19]